MAGSATRRQLLPSSELPSLTVAYLVRVTFDRAPARDAFVAWLCSVHVGEVLAAGAEHAEVLITDEQVAVEIRYRFASRDAFQEYEREHAPLLRRKGIDFLSSMGVAPGSGVSFARETGSIVFSAYGRPASDEPEEESSREDRKAERN